MLFFSREGSNVFVLTRRTAIFVITGLCYKLGRHDNGNRLNRSNMYQEGKLYPFSV